MSEPHKHDEHCNCGQHADDITFHINVAIVGTYDHDITVDKCITEDLVAYAKERAGCNVVLDSACRMPGEWEETADETEDMRNNSTKLAMLAGRFNLIVMGPNSAPLNLALCLVRVGEFLQTHPEAQIANPAFSQEEQDAHIFLGLVAPVYGKDGKFLRWGIIC